MKPAKKREVWVTEQYGEPLVYSVANQTVLAFPTRAAAESYGDAEPVRYVPATKKAKRRGK